jgi:hypothetical protein
MGRMGATCERCNTGVYIAESVLKRRVARVGRATRFPRYKQTICNDLANHATPNIPTSQHPNIPTSQHPNIPTSQHPNIPTSQHPGIRAIRVIRGYKTFRARSAHTVAVCSRPQPRVRAHFVPVGCHPVREHEGQEGIVHGDTRRGESCPGRPRQTACRCAEEGRMDRFG